MNDAAGGGAARRGAARRGDGPKMAALQAERGYGLSCGRLGRGTRLSVFHVKLTDSAVRAFEAYQACKVRPARATPRLSQGL